MTTFDDALHPRNSVGMFEEKNHTAPDVTLSEASTEAATAATLLERYDVAELNYGADGESGYEDYEDEKLALADEFLDLLVREPPSPERNALIDRFNENARYAAEHTSDRDWEDERSYEHWEDTQCDLAYDSYGHFYAKYRPEDADVRDVASKAIDAQDPYFAAALNASQLPDPSRAHISRNLRGLISKDFDEEPALYVSESGEGDIVAMTDSKAAIIAVSPEGEATSRVGLQVTELGQTDAFIELLESGDQARLTAREIGASVERGDMSTGEGVLAAARLGKPARAAHLSDEVRERVRTEVSQVFADEPLFYVPADGFSPDGYIDVIADDGSGRPWKVTFEPDGELSHSYRV